MNAECPKCGEQFQVAITAVVPDEQVLYLELKSESEYFAAKTVGKVIANMEAVLKEVANNVGEKVVVFLKSVDLKPNTITVGLMIAKVTAKSPHVTPEELSEKERVG
jgi:hypothetical protein